MACNRPIDWEALVPRKLAMYYESNDLVRFPPRWRVEPVDATAVVGDSVVFDCQAEGYPQPLIRWKKASGENSASRNFKSIISNYHIQTLENGSLSIKDLTEEDRGHYLCEAANGVGADLSTVVKLSVHGR
ncbi:down syndrome cell adhesion molecule [Trichonephila inaurata madagascariensis]|uniref:Down syndrome cell adhesion molecule n=1 Tax=Trichonephila inaurata madagascariensis TaxID=2747483 RepID=A0A8X7BZP9_9ARAC|nr:down syndrome cell adhesion molecule [Trichonephila inaurata madagascariensis]